MTSYIGTNNPIPGGVRTKYYFKALADGALTLFGLDLEDKLLTYSVGYLSVYNNGKLLCPNIGNEVGDYSASDGGTIILKNVAKGDILIVETYGVFSITDTLTQAQLNTTLAQIQDNISNKFIGDKVWHFDRKLIQDGEIALDGQLLLRDDYPELWELLKPVAIDDMFWRGSPELRGCVTTGDGATTFRLPDINGKYEGSILSPVLRGDGKASAGKMAPHAVDKNMYNSTYVVNNSLTRRGAASGSSYADVMYQSSLTETKNNFSAVTNIDDDTHPNEVYIVWCIVAKGKTKLRMSDGAIPTLTGTNNYVGILQNNGSDVVTKDSFYDTLESVVLYPNGSAANPPTLSSGQRIVTDNPFNSENVIASLQIKATIDGVPTWVCLHDGGFNDRGWTGGNCSVFKDSLVIQGGQHCLTIDGSSLYMIGVTTGRLGIAPYRVRVFRLGE